MTDYKITSEQLETAKQFFRKGSIDALTTVSRKINKEQPNFTAVVLALEQHGLIRIIVKDLLESIFTIYYIQTELNKKSISTISSEQVIQNVTWFNQFIGYYNQEIENASTDLTQIQFLRDEVVLKYSAETLLHLFGDPRDIPKEVVFGYYALLKGIEIGAEKS